MGNIGLPGLLLIALVILLLFGKNRFSNMMGDLAKGVKNFKEGMKEEEPRRPEPRQLPRETLDVEPRRESSVDRDETR